MLQSIFSTDFDFDRLLSFASSTSAAAVADNTQAKAGSDVANAASGGIADVTTSGLVAGDCKSSDSGLPVDEADESSLLLADGTSETPQHQPSPPLSLYQQHKQQLELRLIVRDDPDGCSWGRGSDLVILNSRWQEPVRADLDIRTAHVILDYMESHLADKQKLREEWDELQEAARHVLPTDDQRLFSAARRPENTSKNRRPDRLPYDKSRVRLQPVASASVEDPDSSDYINASLVCDRGCRGFGGHYVLTQSPLPDTQADFWRLVWQTGASGIVSLAQAREPDSPDYWPERGCGVFGDFQVHLVSEHFCCDHFVIRSLRVRLSNSGKHQSLPGPPRTVTQFHYLSWQDGGLPPTTLSLLDFRRKVNKSYRSRGSPLIVHCSDGAGRSGAYCLLDSTLARICSFGVGPFGSLKEVSLAVALEHLRDQRPGLVESEEQFEFVFSAVADELAAVLASLPQ